jgi:hypothetical protein
MGKRKKSVRAKRKKKVNMDAMVELDYEFRRLSLIEELTHEDLKKVPHSVRTELIRHNIGNLHNLEVLLLADCPDVIYRDQFMRLVLVLDPDVSVLALLFRYYCDELADYDYLTHLRAAFARAIEGSRHDVQEMLMEKIGHLMTCFDLQFLLDTAIYYEDVIALRMILRVLQTYEGEKRTNAVNNGDIANALSGSSLEIFDELFLFGFNVFVPFHGLTFPVQAFRMSNEPILTRLYGLNAILDDDLTCDIPKHERRRHYRTILRVNRNINELDKEDGKPEEDRFLRYFIAAQKHPLPAIRALSREVRINNRCATLRIIPHHTEAYLDSLRPECNVSLSLRLVEARKERKRCKRTFLPALSPAGDS